MKIITIWFLPGKNAVKHQIRVSLINTGLPNGEILNKGLSNEDPHYLIFVKKNAVKHQMKVSLMEIRNKGLPNEDPP